MSSLPLTHSRPLPQQLGPQNAWKLRNALHALCDVLWDTYELEFLAFGAGESENRRSAQSPDTDELPF
jgi:hypothetical protein